MFLSLHSTLLLYYSTTPLLQYPTFPLPLSPSLPTKQNPPPPSTQSQTPSNTLTKIHTHTNHLNQKQTSKAHPPCKDITSDYNTFFANILQFLGSVEDTLILWVWETKSPVFDALNRMEALWSIHGMVCFEFPFFFAFPLFPFAPRKQMAL